MASQGATGRALPARALGKGVGWGELRQRGTLGWEKWCGPRRGERGRWKKMHRGLWRESLQTDCTQHAGKAWDTGEGKLGTSTLTG